MRNFSFKAKFPRKFRAVNSVVEFVLRKGISVAGPSDVRGVHAYIKELMNMQSHFVISNSTARSLWRLIFWAAILIMLLLISYSAASAQCNKNPTGETSVGLQNDSSHYLTFYIDGEKMDGVPAGDRSVDFVVTPGEHALLAEAIIDGETVSASRTVNIPEGFVCTWTVTDPPASSSNLQKGSPNAGQKNLRDALPLKLKAKSFQEKRRRSQASLGSIVWNGML